MMILTIQGMEYTKERMVCYNYLGVDISNKSTCTRESLRGFAFRKGVVYE